MFSHDKLTYKIRHIYGGAVLVDGEKVTVGGEDAVAIAVTVTSAGDAGFGMGGPGMGQPGETGEPGSFGPESMEPPEGGMEPPPEGGMEPPEGGMEPPEMNG